MFGAPFILQSDNWREFSNKIIEALNNSKQWPESLRFIQIKKIQLCLKVFKKVLTKLCLVASKESDWQILPWKGKHMKF